MIKIGNTNCRGDFGIRKVRKVGGTRKIGEIHEPCMSPEHNPPSHMVLEPGVYEHTCPKCGNRMQFTVPRVTCSV